MLNQRPSHLSHVVLVSVVLQVFDGRLAVDPGEKQGGKQRGCTLFHAFASIGSQIGTRQGIKALQESLRRARHPKALQQQVVEAEGKVECGIAVPRALGVEEDWAVRAAQDVLGADVAVDQA